MYNQNDFNVDSNNNAIIVKPNGVEVNYGQLRSFQSESGIEFVAKLHNYGALVEIFKGDSLTMGKFDGRANLNLKISLDDDSLQIEVWVVDNKDVDALCRLFINETDGFVQVEAKARILAIYDSYELKEKSHGLDYFYLDIGAEDIEATTWPRQEMTYALASTILSEATRHETNCENSFDKEVCWTNKYGQLVAVGAIESDDFLVDILGFDFEFDKKASRTLLSLGTLAAE